MFPKLRCGESGVGRHRPIFLNQFNGVFLENLETLRITMKEVDSKE